MQLLLYASDRVASAVLADALERLGLSFAVVGSPSDLPLPSLLLVSAPHLDEPAWGEVTSYLDSGGRVAFLQPEAHALALLGEEEPLSYPFPYLKAEGAWAPFSHLQVLSYPRLVRQRQGEALAYFCLDFSTTARRWRSSYPAVAYGSRGKGHWGVFLYDWARSLLAFHQGQLYYASTGDFPDPLGDGRYRSTHLIHKQVVPELREVPQAHCHELMLLHLLRTLCQELSPLPRLWPLPYPQTTAMILSGDSDFLEGERIRQALDKMTAWRLPYTLFTMPEDLRGLSCEEIAAFQANGADFGLHYYHGPTPSVAEMERGLAADIAAFAEKSLRPLSARGHSCIWVGWDEQARLLASAGFQVSSNFLGRLAYSNGSGLPYRFLSRAGEPIGLWELAMFTGDDVTLIDKWSLPPLTAEAALECTLAALRLSARLYYQPLTFCFHPHYFTGTEPATTPWLEGLAAFSREGGCAAFNVGQWLAFWRARAQVRLAEEVDGEKVRLRLHSPIEGLGIALPKQWAGKDYRGTGLKLVGTGEVLLEANGAMEVFYG